MTSMYVLGPNWKSVVKVTYLNPAWVVFFGTYFIVHDGLVYFEFYSILSLINTPPFPLSPPLTTTHHQSARFYWNTVSGTVPNLCNLVKACIPSKTELLQCLFVLQLHLAALTSLKGEIIELNNRLHHVTSERDILEKQVNRLQVCILHVFVKIGQNVTASIVNM